MPSSSKSFQVTWPRTWVQVHTPLISFFSHLSEVLEISHRAQPMRLLGRWESLMSFSSNSGMISDVRSVMRWLGEFGRSLMFAHFTTTPFGRISKRAPQQTFLMKMNRTWIYDVYDLQILRAHMLKTSSWCCSFRGTAGWLGPVQAKPLCVQHLKFFGDFATWLEKGNNFCGGDRFDWSGGFKSWH